MARRHRPSVFALLSAFAILSSVALIPLAIAADDPPPSETRISGHVFHDRNRNGIQDLEDPPLAGVYVTVLILGQGTLLVPEVTDANGYYEKIVPRELAVTGWYQVTETDPPGYWSVTPNTVEVWVEQGGQAQVNFADHPYHTVHLPLLRLAWRLDR